MSGPSDSLADSLADRLDAISEELAESAIDELKAALRRGESKRPASEKLLTQARRAVDRAAHLLRAIEHEPGNDTGADSAGSEQID